MILTCSGVSGIVLKMSDFEYDDIQVALPLQTFIYYRRNVCISLLAAEKVYHGEKSGRPVCGALYSCVSIAR